MTSETLDDRRSLLALLQRIVGNVQTIVRSEVRLLKVELLEDGNNLGRASVFLALGAALGQLAVGCLLLSAIYLLSTRIQPWLAAVLVAGVTGATATALMFAGKRRLAALAGTQQQTLEPREEHSAWPAIADSSNGSSPSSAKTSTATWRNSS